MTDSLTAPITANEPATTSLPAPTADAKVGGPLEGQPAPAADDDESRYVPLPALHHAREEVRQLKEQLAAATAKTSEVDTLRQQIAELSARMPQAPPAPEMPAAPLLADDAADSLARTLQLFAADGTPDRAAARTAGGIMAQMAKAEAQRAVAPIVEMSAAERAQQFRARAEQVRDIDGNPVNPALLRQMFAVVPDELVAANPQVPALLTYAAAGYERLHGKRPVAPQETSPIVSERTGGRPDAPVSLSEFEMGFLQRSGQDPKKYAASLKGYKPGLPTTLE